MRWTEEEYREFMARSGNTGLINKADLIPAPPIQPQSFAHGRLPVGGMNKTEAAYDAHLWLLRHSGDILWHKFEGIKLRLAPATFLTVDFAVLSANWILEMREVKGFMRDDAAVKLKVAASIYPFRFILVRAKKGGWEETEIAR